jgi:WD40 repeat protein
MNRILVVIYLLLYFNSYASVKPDVVITTGHNDQINAMSISSDNRFLASTGNNKIIIIWDISSNREFRSISGMDGRPYAVKFSPDNIHLAALSSSDELIIWNVVTGEQIANTKASTASYNIIFFDNGNKVLFVNNDSKLSIYNIKSKTETIVSEDIYCTDFVADTDKNIVYAMDLKGEMNYINLKTNEILKKIKLFDKAKFSMHCSKLSYNKKYIISAYIDDIIRVFDIEQGKFTYSSSKSQSKIMAFEIDKVKPYIYYSFHSGDVVFFDYQQKKIIHTYKDSSFIVNCFASYPSGDAIAIANYNVIKLVNLKTKKPFKYFKPKISKIVNLAYDQQGKYLAVATDKVKIYIWDLKLNKIKYTLDGFFPCEFSPDGKELMTMSYSTNMACWNTRTWKKKYEYKTEYELIQKIAYSLDGKYVAGAGYQNVVKIWDRSSQKLIKKLKGHTAGILALDFHPTKPIIASGSHDGTLKIWDFEKGKELNSFTDQTISISGVKFNFDGSLLASSAWDKSILIRNTNDWSIIKTLKGHTNTVMGVDFNKTGNVLVSYSGNNSVDKADNSLIFWNVNTGQQICQIKDHESGINKAFFDLDADYVFSGSDDGTIKISDYKKKKTIATYLAIDNKEFMIYTPDNYYIASKKALQSIAFRINNKLLSFDQFDIYLNRPDIVAKEIGKSDPQLIRAYEYLHKKRLRKYNIDEESLNLNYHVPNLIITNKPPLITDKTTTSLTVKTWDDLYDLKQINIYVNGTPIYGEKGFEITEKVKSYQKTFEIPLLNGINKIHISSVNSNNAESIYENIEIAKDISNEKPNLYLVSIGVSNYKDMRFKLTYPSKDANDVVTTLTKAKNLYNDIHTKVLIDSNVTLNNFEELSHFFMNCKYNDIAIIFMAGHGVLDENFDYYFGTYNMDFNNPKNGGLPYDAIHNLLNRIKAYKKILIMDTCHSGELDKEEIERGPEPEVNDGDIEFRAAGVAVREKQGVGFENSLDIASDIFSDTRKGSGAIVISSAGGAEYAMESSEWKNGLFTYAFLKGFVKEKIINYQAYFNADYNLDGVVEVSEIRKYVYTLVKDLSSNKQEPSSREDNIEQDYAIFVE